MTPATQRKHRKYDASPKGKARLWRYRATAKGRAINAAVQRRYYSKPEVQEQHRWIGLSWRLKRKLRENAL